MTSIKKSEAEDLDNLDPAQMSNKQLVQAIYLALKREKGLTDIDMGLTEEEKRFLADPCEIGRWNDPTFESVQSKFLELLEGASDEG